MLSFVDELELASNAYRTKGYIVTQRIMFRNNKADALYYELRLQRKLRKW